MKLNDQEYDKKHHIHLHLDKNLPLNLKLLLKDFHLILQLRRDNTFELLN